MRRRRKADGDARRASRARTGERGGRSVLFRGAVLALAAALGAASGARNAFAERADRDKPVNIESDTLVVDDAKRIATFEGHVVLTQGTLLIRADKLVVHQDAQGFQYGVATGNPTTFKQKRDNVDEYVYGEAQRIEYDGRKQLIQFFDNARLRRDNGDDVRGAYISYDENTEYFTVTSSRDAPRGSRDARVRAVIMPKSSGQAPSGAAPLPLKPLPAIAPPGKD